MPINSTAYVKHVNVAKAFWIGFQRRLQVLQNIFLANALFDCLLGLDARRVGEDSVALLLRFHHGRECCWVPLQFSSLFGVFLPQLRQDKLLLHVGATQ